MSQSDDAEWEKIDDVPGRGGNQLSSSEASASVRLPDQSTEVSSSIEDPMNGTDHPARSAGNRDAQDKPGEGANRQSSCQISPSAAPVTKPDGFTSVKVVASDPNGPNREPRDHKRGRALPKPNQDGPYPRSHPDASQTGGLSTSAQTDSTSSREGRINDTGGKHRSGRSHTDNRQLPVPEQHTVRERGEGHGRDLQALEVTSRHSEQPPSTHHSTRHDSRRGNGQRAPAEHQGDPEPTSSSSGSSSAWNLNNIPAWLGQSRSEVKELKERNRHLQFQITQQSTRIAKTEKDLHEAEKQTANSKALADTRLTELKSLQELMPMNDGLSGAELKGKCEVLNSEIEQTAAIIVDSLTDTPIPNPLPSIVDPTQNCIQYLSGANIIDMRLVSSLQNPGNDDVSSLVQAALQASMANSCAGLMGSIAPRHELEAPLQRAMEGIKESSPFPVFAKWRALTHQECTKTADQFRQLNYLLDPLRPLLYLAGRIDIFSEESPLVQNLRDRLWGLLRLTLELNKVLMQQIFTMDVYPFVPFAGEAYQPHTMQSDGPPSQSISGPGINPSQIICTTGIGLAFCKATSSGMKREIALKARVETQQLFI
ncbi:hypothetical protein BDN72DRAFT_846735 [Pluteus cervinus]|uniref:Uncharacterized protein n=1 Tax=Pluteus cervinus TaxID=181527 RepID=A0ACD3AF76_9AGAR|nr:hypothetical protein BDN72DRAFT_846735 [Pluteus cervinus]